MKILYVTSEVSPFVCTGGLGEVSASLPRAINKSGKAEVSVVLPMYLSVKDRFYSETELVYEGYLSLSWRRQYIGVRRLRQNGVVYYFIDNEYYFGRELIYGNYDDGERFAYFGRAVCEMIENGIAVPDILHANDWQSALSIVYLKRQYENLLTIPCLFTLHNVAYQGKYSPAISSDVFGLADEDAAPLLYDGDLNLLKGAATLSDCLTTVSPTYAKELKDGYFTFGLCDIFKSGNCKIQGIMNGIDTSYDPLHDPGIPASFGKKDLSGKAECRAKLCSEFCVENKEGAPIISMVTRLTPQKGIDLVLNVIEELINQTEIIFVILGSGNYEYEGFFRALSEKYCGRIGFISRFDNDLSRLVYAGSDLFLMPSLFEPCGIAQMIAMKYGAVPIVRETGGLKDSVVPYNEYTNEGTGFSFANYNAFEMKNTIEYAISVFRDSVRWRELTVRAMSVDNSWKKSGSRYVDIYREMLR